MKILVLADVESKYLWDYFEKEKLEGIDLILSCGDLKADYLKCLYYMCEAITMMAMQIKSQKAVYV